MTNLEIIKRLKTAKDLYDTKPGSDKNGGMCHYMKQALIPEFNPEFLGGNVQGDIDANSVKIKGRHTGSINV